jgi:hypothetical protein
MGKEKKDIRRDPVSLHDKQGMAACAYSANNWHGKKMCKACEKISEVLKENEDRFKAHVLACLATLERPEVSLPLKKRILASDNTLQRVSNESFDKARADVSTVVESYTR